MPKIGNNPVMKTLSGMLGDVIVFRQSRGKMIMSNRPKKRSKVSDLQLGVNDKFVEASAYAKGQMKDPNSKAMYQVLVGEKFASAYSAALSDYLKGPKIMSVDNERYAGVIGDTIAVKAIDNVKVTEVSVEIRSAADALIEKGAAVPDVDNVLVWNYVVTQTNAGLPGSKVIVSAKDKPGNVTVKEVILK